MCLFCFIIPMSTMQGLEGFVLVLSFDKLCLYCLTIVIYREIQWFSGTYKVRNQIRQTNECFPACKQQNKTKFRQQPNKHTWAKIKTLLKENPTTGKSHTPESWGIAFYNIYDKKGSSKSQLSNWNNWVSQKGMMSVSKCNFKMQNVLTKWIII